MRPHRGDRREGYEPLEVFILPIGLLALEPFLNRLPRERLKLHGRACTRSHVEQIGVDAQELDETFPFTCYHELTS